MENSNKIIVAFHIGRGGQFYNGGHITFIGELDYQDLIKLNANHLYYKDRDEIGRFCKSHLTDQNGTVIVEDLKAEVGQLNFDNQYDTDFCDYIESCSETLIDLIKKSTIYKSHKLVEWLENN